MNKVFNLLFEIAGIKNQRTKNVTKHIGLSTLYKAGSIIANFILVPLTIAYLDTENYGVWLTLTSFISWFSFFDVGLGNGLRNKFAEAKTLGDYNKARAFISTAYFTIGCLSLIVLFVFFGINQCINWSQFFNTQESLNKELYILMPIIFTFFSLQLVVKLITNIYQGNQNHSIQVKIQFFTQILSLIAIYLLIKNEKSSLLIFGSVFSAIPVIILLGLHVFAFKTTFKAYKPKFSLWKMEYFKEITGLGLKFFIIQIAALVLFSTDNFIISKLFGPEEVVPYNIAFKYFSILTMVYTIVLTPFWSSFTEAYAKKDYEWIKESVLRVQKIWCLIPIGLVVMVFSANWFYNLWIGDSVFVPLKLSLAMGFFVLLLTFNMIYVNFINGVGKIKLQLLTSLLSMIINIPLSVYLGKHLDWGSTGVIMATCFSLSYSVILRPIQYYKLINNTAKGIWNK